MYGMCKILNRLNNYMDSLSTPPYTVGREAPSLDTHATEERALISEDMHLKSIVEVSDVAIIHMNHFYIPISIAPPAKSSSISP